MDFVLCEALNKAGERSAGNVTRAESMSTTVQGPQTKEVSKPIVYEGGRESREKGG